MKPNILFLCTGNSCRSQMAEGWGRALLSDQYDFYSAGTIKSHVNPYAIQVMNEVSVDISQHESNCIDELPDVEFDLVITLCSDAHENCPYFPAKKIIHRGFDDPPKLTADFDDEALILKEYRRVRDEIKDYIQSLESGF